MESFKLESFETDERVEDPVYALGRDLGLTLVPRNFVCIDISTNQGRDTVGSLVWFEAGRPKKSEYRRFVIRGSGEGGPGSGAAGAARRSVEESAPAGPPVPDDFAAIHEVVTRFVRRRLDEHKSLPDLLLVDGGKGQLGAAGDALAALCVGDLPLASLAKRLEEVFLPGRRESVRLAQRSPSLKLLQRARDEAHRFAIAHSRSRRAKRTITSELLEIPGVGEARRRLLLERFGSLAAIRTASSDEIAALPSFSRRLADRIIERVRSK
jgi:excinuclease ABC subunit C